MLVPHSRAFSRFNIDAEPDVNAKRDREDPKVGLPVLDVVAMARNPILGSNACSLFLGMQIVSALTVSITNTYRACNPQFVYSSRPRVRPAVLTKPTEPVRAGGFDNANDDLIVSVDDEFVSSLGTRYDRFLSCVIIGSF